MKKSFKDFYVDVSSSEYLERLIAGLDTDGIVTFDHMYSVDQFVSLAELLGSIFQHRDSDTSGVTRIASKGVSSADSGYLGFSTDELLLHTDRSSVAEPPVLLLFFCGKQAKKGGASVFLDARNVYRALSDQFPDVLEALLVPQSAIFGGVDSLFVGSIFTKLTDGDVYVRFRYDSLGFFSAPLISSLPTLLQLMDDYSFSFCLKKHQGYIIQNGRWLHGRTDFVGEREMFRVLVTPDVGSPIEGRIKFGFTP